VRAPGDSDDQASSGSASPSNGAGEPAGRLGKLKPMLVGGAARLAGPSGAALLSRGGQTLLALVLARMLGPEGYGLFVFALGVAVLAAMFAGFGWPNVINREMHRLIREQAWSLLRGLNRAADMFAMLAAAALSLLFLAASLYFTDFAAGLRLAALLTVPLAVILMRQQQLVAVDRPTLGMMLDQGMAATFVLLIVLIRPMGPEGTLAAYAAVVIALAGVGTLVFRARLPEQARAAPPRYRWREWLASGAAMFGSLLSLIVVTRLDAILIAPLAGLHEAGLYGSAYRLSLLMTFPQFLVQTLVTPRFSRAFAAGDLTRVRRLYGLTVAFAAATALPFLLPAVLAPELIMRTLFGEEFTAGAPALFWLGVGQFIFAFGIALTTMIAMGGNHKAMGRQGIAIALLTLAAGYLIVPTYGAVGGAALLAASNALWVTGMAWLAYPILRKNDQNLRPSTSTWRE